MASAGSASGISKSEAMGGRRGSELDRVSENRDLPRLTSDGGTQKDDEKMNANLPAGRSGSTAHAFAGRDFLTNEDKGRLTDYARNHTLEESLAVEKALLAGKKFDEAVGMAGVGEAGGVFQASSGGGKAAAERR